MSLLRGGGGGDKKSRIEKLRPGPQGLVADVLTGKVTFTNGTWLEITCGPAMKPDAKLYVDGNPLRLEMGDRVVIKLAKWDEETNGATAA